MQRRISLDELATHAELSRFHFVRAFKRHTGFTPHAFQIRLRLERARALLTSGVSPAETAVSVGFADQSHFTRHFKRLFRMTPGEFIDLQQNRPRGGEPVPEGC